jgi:SAM-dependent methyltransferase
MAADLCRVSTVRGTWIYSTPVLRIYDWLVPGLMNRFVWHCPATRLLRQYREHVGAHHIDLGAGTGFYLRQLAEEGSLPSGELTLVDACPACLRYAARVLHERRPRQLRLDLTDGRGLAPFAELRADSVAASYLIHCLPHGLRDAQEMLAAVSRVIGEQGIFFGSLILPDLYGHHIGMRICSGLFNLGGIFGNRSDSRRDLERGLASNFEYWHVETVGSVALFTAHNRTGHGNPS